MSNKFIVNFLLLASVLLSSCNTSTQIDIKSNTPQTIFTITLQTPETIQPTETSLPPSPPPTIVPVQGFTATQLNVRAQPSTASEVLGIIPANVEVQIIGRDPGNNWWQIIYETGVESSGWVAAQYVQVAGEPAIPSKLP